uniref:L,D-transpeptidase family protein n=1 Tax=Thaumasiovibrio occultus TaxID=1891184 RepID=UPI000B35C33E|nr:L,D-transpeptidase family protein [Thaumasiovibrio occultus]
MIKYITVSLFFALTVAGYLLYNYGRAYWVPVYNKYHGYRSVEDVINQYGDDARARLSKQFEQAGVAYPPKRIALLAVKDEASLELWAEQNEQWIAISQYPVLAASGVAGPKLREGDRQVPEGIYQIIGLNPNSAYHLSMKLNYPNRFDLKWAEKEGRSEPGTNIFIHGKALSIGCLAMGDPAIEDLFTLVHDTGKAQVTVIIAPSDPRKASLVAPQDSPEWVNELYRTISEHFLAVSPA